MKLTVEIKRQTEKAINAEVYFWIGGDTYTWMMWFPKSRISMIDEHHIDVEYWLVKKFENELDENHPNNRVSTAARIHSIEYQF